MEPPRGPLVGRLMTFLMRGFASYAKRNNNYESRTLHYGVYNATKCRYADEQGPLCGWDYLDQRVLLITEEDIVKVHRWSPKFQIMYYHSRFLVTLDIINCPKCYWMMLWAMHCGMTPQELLDSWQGNKDG